ncbi:MAG: type II toxin-antitoxin system Phd/YefM family antitoxin [Treponema sp.]|nr:type II toxin-antitoxin system Phd/YefM family antitoxin [Treponema sp.]
MCRATIYDARNNFSSLVKTAEEGEPVELTRHDKPVAVIISWEQYEKKIKKKTFIERMEEIRKEYADVLADPSYEGLVIPKDEYPDEAYYKKIDSIWSEV